MVADFGSCVLCVFLLIIVLFLIVILIIVLVEVNLFIVIVTENDLKFDVSGVICRAA